MKKLIILGALGLLAPLMSVGQSTFGPGTITTSLTQSGSPHNFADQSWNPAISVGGVYVQQGGQICQPCHTPHNAKTGAALLIPLWNHTATTGLGYNMYTKFGAASELQGVLAPNGLSLMCLSCHDGSVALGSFGGLTGATFIGAGYTWYSSGTAANAGALLSKDLRNDHPISISMNATSTSRPLSGFASSYTSPGVYTSTGKALSTWLDNATIPGQGLVQCTSCHGPHSNKVGYQLKQSNQGSAICITCHAK